MEITREQQAQLESQWRERVKQDYRNFLQTHPHLSEAQLCEYTGLDPVEAEKIRRGRNISTVISSYAILYYHCGINSADPTEIPARFIHPPGAEPMLVERAWSKQAYLRWLVSIGNAESFAKLGQTSLQLALSGAHPQSGDLAGENMGYLLLILFNMVSKYPPATRDEFVNTHRKKLKHLAELLDLLLLPRGERERAIQVGERLDLKAITDQLEEVLNGEETES